MGATGEPHFSLGGGPLTPVELPLPRRPDINVFLTCG